MIARLAEDQERVWSLFRGTTWWLPLPDSFMSVSYTHLDVYKRQSLRHPQAQDTRGKAEREGAADPAGPTHLPVSPWS